MFYSFQRKKRERDKLKFLISQLSRTEEKKVRQQEQQDQRKHREGKRAMEEILNLTPESINTSPIEVQADLQPNPQREHCQFRYTAVVMSILNTTESNKQAESNKHDAL